MAQAGRSGFKIAICIAAALGLSACSLFRPDTEHQHGESRIDDGSGGQPLFGSLGDGNRNSNNSAPAGIAVNSYLWRASLDTLNFLPLVSADPFGGVIITDWHSEAAAPDERFKATVYILDTRLRADALNVSIFRQQRVNGQWTDAPVNPDTEAQIENAILARARELRLGAAGNN